MGDNIDQMFENSVKNMVDKIMNYNDKSLMRWVIDYEPTNGYMFNDNPQLTIIDNLVSEDGHSGASFAMCLRRARQELINMNSS